ncbi:MAG: hypothetical protein WCV90_01730 [Candidatus Woesearchaeota archaeon]|jgi:hypothetical protein
MDNLDQYVKREKEFAEKLYLATNPDNPQPLTDLEGGLTLSGLSEWGIKLNVPFSLGCYEEDVPYNVRQLGQTMGTIDRTMREYYARPEVIFTEPFCVYGGREHVSLFDSAEGIRWMYEICQGGALTLRPLRTLEPELKNALEGRGISWKKYNPVRTLCILFNNQVLRPFWQAGNLKDAGVFEDVNDEPAWNSFKDSHGSYLTPTTILQFLVANNGTGGPRELFFDYSASDSKESPVNHFFSVQHSPTEKRLELSGYWKVGGKVMDRKVMVESLASLLSGKKIS